MLALRATRLLAAERAKLDHDRRPNATNEVLRKGQISSIAVAAWWLRPP